LFCGGWKAVEKCKGGRERGEKGTDKGGKNRPFEVNSVGGIKKVSEIYKNWGKPCKRIWRDDDEGGGAAESAG